MDNTKILRLRKKASELPTSPGVYIMRDKKGVIIYIGKAKSLRNRVSSYFRNIENHYPKVYKMVEMAEDFEVIITRSEFEALVLECSLIKQHTPKYNILLKDDKGFNYIKITKSKYPRIQPVKTNDGEGEFIGPFMSSFVVKQTVDEANKAFKLPTCNRVFPRDFGKERPCLNFYMKQCMGVCRGKTTEEEYADIVKEAMQFIKGGGKEAIPILKEKMQLHSDNLEFEQAANYRDRIEAIKRITEEQHVVDVFAENHTFVAFARSYDRAAVSVLRFHNHRLVDKEDFILGDHEDIAELRGEFVASYFSNHKNVIPRYICLDGETEDSELLSRFLTETRGSKVEVLFPKRGEAVRLLTLAKQNAAEHLALSKPDKRTAKEIAALDELGKLLGLSKPPKLIESYDISNISDSVIVGGLITFKDGKPYKAGYKRFKINDMATVDDYGSMRQMLRRRFNRYKEGDEGFSELPDLILMDGGVGHLGVAEEVLKEFSLKIPVFGMVKDNRHRTRAIVGEEEIAINSSRQAFTLVSEIQNEVHRFAISYAKSSHKKNTLKLTLTEIPTIGEARAKALLLHFKTLSAIKSASTDELSNVKGIDERSAKEIYKYFNENS